MGVQQVYAKKLLRVGEHERGLVGKIGGCTGGTPSSCEEKVGGGRVQCRRKVLDERMREIGGEHVEVKSSLDGRVRGSGEHVEQVGKIVDQSGSGQVRHVSVLVEKVRK